MCSHAAAQTPGALGPTPVAVSTIRLPDASKRGTRLCQLGLADWSRWLGVQTEIAQKRRGRGIAAQKLLDQRIAVGAAARLQDQAPVVAAHAGIGQPHPLEAGEHVIAVDLGPEIAVVARVVAKEVAEASEITFTSLPAPVDVEAVALGDAGILEGAKPGSIYIDLSSNSVSLVRQIHSVFESKGVHMLDAPVSGGVSGARSGRLAVMVGAA